MGEYRTTGLTWADLAHFPDDNLRRELIDGELHVTPSPRERHQWVVTWVHHALLDHVRPEGGRAYQAPLDVIFDESNVAEPDVLVFVAQHLDRIRDGYPRAAPDLVVEVTSVSTMRTDRVRKRALYERFGVAEYWIVDLQDDFIEAYTLEGGGYGPPTVYRRGDTVTSRALAGFAAPYDKLVPPPDE